MKSQLLYRCPLMAPAIHPKFFEKGKEVGADIVVVDWEDGVPEERKQEARENSVSFFRDPNPGVARGLRINRIDSEIGIRDLTFCFDYGLEPDLLMIPMVESDAIVNLVDKLTCEKMPNTVLAPIIETARGLTHCFEIGDSTNRVGVLFFGAWDFCADMGIELGWEELHYARSRLIVSAKSAKVPVVDAPLFDIYDSDGLARESKDSHEMGYAGKAAVHPSQVETIKKSFTPCPEKIAHAHRILDAMKKSNKKICVVDGKMVGPPAVIAAKKLIEFADRIFDRY